MTTEYTERPSRQTRDTQLDLEVRTAIKMLCKDYGIPVTRFFELSELNNPHSVAPISYGTFGNVMAGAPLTEDQEAAIAHSLATVRQELRHMGIAPLEKALPKQLAALLKAHFDEDSDDVFTAQELSDLRRILRAGQRRL